MKRLTIITACSRPQNLPALMRSIEPGRVHFAITWRVVFDGLRVASHEVPALLAVLPAAAGAVVSDRRSRFGNYQRNHALEHTVDGWVYFLDDDNLIHPDFFAAAARAIDETDASGFAFPQLGGCGKATEQACPEHMKPDHIDLAQVLLSRELIAASRFQLPTYNADGHFIAEIYQRDPRAWAFLEKPLCFYNALRSEYVH